MACPDWQAEPYELFMDANSVWEVSEAVECMKALAPLRPSWIEEPISPDDVLGHGAIAGALNAKRLLLLTDVPGVLDKDKNLIPELTIEQCRRLIADGTISGGMIPKIETCIYALEKGVEAVVILDGKVPHAALIELFTDTGSGTIIRR